MLGKKCNTTAKLIFHLFNGWVISVSLEKIIRFSRAKKPLKVHEVKPFPDYKMLVVDATSISKTAFFAVVGFSLFPMLCLADFL